MPCFTYISYHAYGGIFAVLAHTVSFWRIPAFALYAQLQSSCRFIAGVESSTKHFAFCQNSLLWTISSTSENFDFISPIVFCAVLSALRLSSSFLLIGMHGRIHALSWTKTGRPKICAAALEVLHPVKLLSQNMHSAFLAPPFLVSVWFVSAKYCHTKCAASRSSGCSGFALSMSTSHWQDKKTIYKN